MGVPPVIIHFRLWDVPFLDHPFWKNHIFARFSPHVQPRLSALKGCHVPQAVGANGEVPGTDDLDAGAKRVNPEVKTITAAMDDKAEEKIPQRCVNNDATLKIC